MHTLSGGRQRLEMWTTRPDQSLLLTDRLTKAGDQHTIYHYDCCTGAEVCFTNEKWSDVRLKSRNYVKKHIKIKDLKLILKTQSYCLLWHTTKTLQVMRPAEGHKSKQIGLIWRDVFICLHLTKFYTPIPEVSHSLLLHSWIMMVW